MFFIPGSLISLVTFPGVIVHEWAHKKFCEWFDVKVLEVVYFRFNGLFNRDGKPAGYVIHGIPVNFKQTFWISVGPLIINSFGCIFLSYIASQTIPESFLSIFILWLALSVGAHSFPSDHDAKSILETSKQHIKTGGSALHYFSYPFFLLIWLANKLRFFWFDFIYAVLLMQLGGGIH